MRIFRQAFETIGGSKQRDKSNESVRAEQEQSRTQSVGPYFHVDKKYQTPDFLFQSPKASTNPQVKPASKKAFLTKNFFSNLSQLESKMSMQHQRTVEVIDTLVSMYKQCVEVYDAVQDPIKYYFVDKIQSALADGQTLRLIGNNNIEVEKEKQRRQSDRMQSLPDKLRVLDANSEEGEIFHDIVEEIGEQTKEFSQNFERTQLQCEDTLPLPLENSFMAVEEDQMRKKQRARSKQVSIIKQIQTEEQHSNDNMNSMVFTYHLSASKTDKLIMDSFQTQEQSLQERLKKRGHRGSKGNITLSKSTHQFQKSQGSNILQQFSLLELEEQKT